MTRLAQRIGIELELATYLKGEPVVAGRFMNACKDKPAEINGHLIHRDASMVELAMKSAGCPRELAHNYQDALSIVVALLPDDVSLLAAPAVEYTSEELKRDPYASVMGCSASRNVYLAEPTPSEYQDNTRYSGMHVNIQVDDPREEDALALDVYLGLFSVIHWEQEHKEAIIKRRECYGQAGEFRIKDFGIEYRTLPSCAFDPMHTQTVWQLVDQALSCTPQQIDAMIPRMEDIWKAIQTCDAELAHDLIAELH